MVHGFFCQHEKEGKPLFELALISCGTILFFQELSPSSFPMAIKNAIEKLPSSQDDGCLNQDWMLIQSGSSSIWRPAFCRLDLCELTINVFTSPSSTAATDSYVIASANIKMVSRTIVLGIEAACLEINCVDPIWLRGAAGSLMHWMAALRHAHHISHRNASISCASMLPVDISPKYSGFSEIVRRSTPGVTLVWF